MVAAKIANLEHGQVGNSRAANLQDYPTRAEAAQKLNVSERTVTNAMKYGIWKKTAAESESWQAEQAAIKDAANAKRSEATKKQPRNDDGTMSTGSGTSSTTTGKAPKKKHKTRKAKASAAKVDAGTVAKMDALESSDPDLHERVTEKIFEISGSAKFSDSTNFENFELYIICTT